MRKLVESKIFKTKLTLSGINNDLKSEEISPLIFPPSLFSPEDDIQTRTQL